MLRAFGSRRNASTGAPPAWEIRMERRRRVDPGVAPTYVGDERLNRPLGRRNQEARRRDPLTVCITNASDGQSNSGAPVEATRLLTSATERDRMLRAFGSRRNASTGAPPSWRIRASNADGGWIPAWR